MATTPRTRVTDLARKYRLDIDTATYPSVNYEQLLGVKSAKLIETLRTVDDEGYEDEGFMREEVTGVDWSIELTLKHSRAAGGTSRLATHEFLRTMFDALVTGGSAAENEFGVRWYHRDGVDDGKEGRVYVKTWEVSDDKAASDEIKITLKGQGVSAIITNPNGSALPVVSSVSPTGGGTAGGELVTVNGGHFTGTTAVKFGTTDATAFTVINDSTIVAIAPAHTAATVQTKVTNAAGSSADTAADNYTYA